MPFSNILLRFFYDPSSMNPLGIALMLMLTIILMVFIRYLFYSMASSLNSSVRENEKSSAPGKEELSSNSSAPEKEESSSNTSEPKITMSSSDSSLITPEASSEMRFLYDVFLSFRGEDTRNNFVGHLHEALQRNCIETYKDDEKIDKGERINDQLLKSIENSKLYIIVFSKNYASSSWCLDELVKIMQCQKMAEHTAYPVFFDVEPTEVRKQIGAVEKAFAENGKKDAAGKWREALIEASNLAGWELKATANGDESKLIQMIVDVIFIKHYSTLPNTDEKLVGMETRIGDVLSSLKIGAQDVRMIGIKGIGGGGKTTLARAVYDQVSIHFEGKSFVENVREDSLRKPTLSGLKNLQKRILTDVLNKNDIILNNVHDGKRMLKATMSRRKIILVLDDVDCKEQLEALAGDLNWFKSGSRIIITTRDEQVLSSHRVKFVHNINLLSPMEAICLFSMHAFPIELPVESYKKLAGQVLRYASGLPLTIRVLGSLLYGNNNVDEWEHTIQRLEKIPLEETMQYLELSFDSLEKDYQQIFLDVACMLKGWGKQNAITVLKSRGFHAEKGLRVLEQKSLITISGNGSLGMHDHLEEMGRDIVRRVYPDEPYKHSRLWVAAEIEDILANDLGTEETKCLYLRSSDLSAEIAIKGLAKMKNLKFIFIGLENENNNLRRLNPKLVKVCEQLPSSVQYMKWIGFPFSSLPNTFQGKNLVGLNIHGSNIVQLWEVGERKVLTNLKFLRIGYSKLKTFDLRMAPILEQLTIDYCKDFEDLHIPADRHSELKYLTLQSTKLTSLHLGNTLNLKKLILRDGHLVEFQMPAQSLKLEHLDLSHSNLRNLRLGNTPKLKTLDLEGCDNLVQLQMPAKSLYLEVLNIKYSKVKNLDLGNTPNLKTLVVEGCNDLVELQMPAESLKLEYLDLTHSSLTNLHLPYTPKLKKLELSHSKLKTIHLESTPNLETLVLEECNDLVDLEMPAESLKLTLLHLSHSRLKTIHLVSAPNLETLILEGCTELEEFQMSVVSLNLKHLKLSHSKLKTLHLGSTPNLEKLILDGCNDLIEFQMPTESLMLEELYLTHSKLKTLDLGLTPNLKILNLKNCDGMVDINAPVGYLKKLAFADLSCCGRFKSFVFDKELVSDEVGCVYELYLNAEPADVCPMHCDNDFLKIQFSCYVKDSASSFGNFERLISIGFCASINHESFSRSISSLQGIKKLTLEGILTEAPRDLDKLECLEELSFSSTKIRDLPDSICKLKHLKSFKIKSCWLLEKLPDDIDRLESLEKLILNDCKLLQDVPKSICKMKCINSFDLRGCIRVVELPKDIGCLEGLKKLSIEGTGIRRLPDSICELKHLKSFKIKSCWLLEKLPEDIGRLELLEKLVLRDCKLLQDIPISICKMNCIKKLSLRGCIRVVELPEDIGCLESLKELNIEGTDITCLPESIFQLRGMCIVGPMRLADTYGLNLTTRRTYDVDEIVCYI